MRAGLVLDRDDLPARLRLREVQHEDRRGDGKEHRHDPESATGAGTGGVVWMWWSRSCTSSRLDHRTSNQVAAERVRRSGAGVAKPPRRGDGYAKDSSGGARHERLSRRSLRPAGEAGLERRRRSRQTAASAAAQARGAPTADRAGARRCGDRSSTEVRGHVRNIGGRHGAAHAVLDRRERGRLVQGSRRPFAHRDPRGSQGQRRDDEHRASGARDRPHAREATPGPNSGSPRHAGRATPGPCWRT